MVKPGVRAVGIAAILTFACAAPALAQRNTESGMICPGDARCPASVQMEAAAPPPPQDFRPEATEAGVNDGQLEVRTFEANGGSGAATQLIVTSNTPVPNPEPARGRRHAPGR